MMGRWLVTGIGAAALVVGTLAPLEARAQFGGYGGNVLGGVLGGVIAGSIIANSRPRVVYARPRVVYARPRIVYARPARHQPVAARRAAPQAAPRAAVIDASADPFARAKPAVTVPVSNKP